MKSMWYQNLIKPYLTPPAKVFTIAWIILYTLITISCVLYIKSGITKKDILPLGLFILGLILNFSWSYTFFVKHEILLAAFMIAMMLFLLVPVMILFYKKRPVSGFLLIPYFLWLIFALYLNFGIFINNR